MLITKNKQTESPRNNFFEFKFNLYMPTTKIINNSNIKEINPKVI